MTPRRPVVGTYELPRSVRTLSSPPDADYADMFTVCADGDATPEQWARAIFGDVPSAGDRLVWRGFLGLRLDPRRSPDTVAGWRVADRGPEWVRLEAASWYLTGNMIVRATGGRLSLATLLRYENAVGRALWPPLSAVHRALAPDVLRKAVASMEARSTARPPTRPTPCPSPAASPAARSIHSRRRGRGQ